MKRGVLALVLATACSGTAGVRDHAEAVALDTHCRQHTCPTTAAPLNLGDGCYAVDDRLYQCSTDGPSEASCFEVSPCAEVCDNKVFDHRGFEVSTDRCESLWRGYREAHRPPPTCAPIEVIAIGSAATRPRWELALPDALVLEVARTGKSKVIYEAEACATGDGVVVVEPTHATGFAELDDILRGEGAKVSVTPGECVTVTLLVSPFDCH